MRFCVVLVIFLLLGSSAGCLGQSGLFQACEKKQDQVDRDWCYFQSARQTNDISACDSIGQQEVRENCDYMVGVVSGQRTFCNRIQNNSNLMYSCYALTTQDPSYCDEIGDETLKHSCYNGTGVKNIPETA